MRKQLLDLRLKCAARILLTGSFALAPLLASPLIAQKPDPPAPTITAYAIDAELDPATHHLSAKTVVTFTAPPQVDAISFGLNPALKITAIADESGKMLTADRAADGTISVSLAAPLAQGQPLRWTFEYNGILTGSSPEKDQRLAAIEDPISYLLYPSRWFPVSAAPSGYLTNRFTAEMHIRVPQGMQVFASGAQGSPKPVTLANGQPGSQYDYNWSKPGFPGTVIAGRYVGPFSAGAGNVKVYLTAGNQQSGNDLAQTAAKEFDFFTASFGAPQSTRLNVVELPGDAHSPVWAPELAAIPGSLVSGTSGVRLLANTIARQWWGSEISPRTLNDAWITNGMARYAELMYVENESVGNALQSAIPDIAAGALAYDTVPLSSAARLNPFSPQFQFMTLEKGAMVFHMLRWELGDQAFLSTLKAALSQFAGSSISSSEFEKVAQAESRKPLTPFFMQWIDGTGAPRFTANYDVYRLGNNKGFRTVGEIQQDLDLFRMPVELSVETEGKTESKTIDVAGPNTQFSIDTFGLPRHIVVDPQNWVLKSTPALEVRVAILRGQQLAAQGDLNGALAEYQKGLQINPQSSLLNYRIGDVLFNQRNYQASVDAYRDALRGDGEPHWTMVWSHIQIGKIYDLTGQRDRAVSEYREAIQTNDNSQGAVNEARQGLQTPYKLPGSR